MLVVYDILLKSQVWILINRNSTCHNLFRTPHFVEQDMRQEDPETWVDILRQQIPGLLGIYVFGSTATGSEHTNSDIDIALLADRAQEPVALWEIAQKLAQQAREDVDLVDLRGASAVFRMQVIASGKRLFCADFPKCEAFEDFVFSDFARLNEERAGILQDIAQRKQVYG